jgi:hypothetical protein
VRLNIQTILKENSKIKAENQTIVFLTIALAPMTNAMRSIAFVTFPQKKFALLVSAAFNVSLKRIIILLLKKAISEKNKNKKKSKKI